jgi:hypothetical protein
MTDVPRRKARWSRGRLRTLAWATGIATFLAGVGALGASPMPETAQPPREDRRVPRQRVIVRRITRRVVVVEPATSAPVTYVQAPSVSSSSSSSGSAPAPAPPPPTGGS